MNNKIIKTFILVMLLALLIGLASATDVSTDTTSTPTVDVPADTMGMTTAPSVVEDTAPTTTGTVQESVTSKQTKNKEIIKEEKNKKTATPINVGNYDQLETAFGSSDTVVTVNITANITLEGSLSTNINKLTIEGNGFTISGNQHQFLNIPNGSTVTINNLTITNCQSYDGGAINNNGNITLTNTNLNYNNAAGVFNVGGAIYNKGTLTITESNLTHNTAKENGGAIYNNEGATVKITNSNLTHNNVEWGGGAIYNYGGILNITESNLTHNTARYGGVLYNTEGGTLTITNSNLTENNANAFGGAIYNKGSVVCAGSTFDMNTPSDYDNSNTFILYDNAVTNYTQLVDAVNYAKKSNKEEYSIYLLPGDYNATANMTWGETNQYTRKLIINGNNITLDGNQNHQFMHVNRGYNFTLKNITLTNYTSSYGGAIDNSGNLTITDSTLTHNNATIYGGAIRNQGSVICTGSTFDMNTPANYIISKENEPHKIQLYSDDGFITTNEDNVVIYLDNNETSNYTGRLSDYNVTKGHKIRLTVNGTDTTTFRDNTFILYSYDKIVTNYTQLIEAVKDAKKSYEEEYSIYLLPGDYNATADLFWGDTNTHTSKLTINGNNITIDGNNLLYSFMTVFTDYSLTLKNITLTNFHGTWGGALSNSYGNLTIIDSNLINNTAKFGGAIHNNYGNVTIINSNLTHNNATNDGGAIRNWGNLTITNSNFNYNRANRDGGAIYHSVSGNSTLNITNSNFTNNSAKDCNGAAIYNMSGGVVCTGSTFYNNTPANYIVTKNNGQYYLKLDKTDDFINMASVSLFVDEESTPIYSGSNLDEYCLPAGNHKISLVVNGTDSAQFNNNTFIIESQINTDNFNVSDYKGLVYAVNYAKTTSYENYTINLLPGDYNATANMKWGEKNQYTRKLIINGNNITLDGNKNHQFMYISNEYNLTLKNITLTNYNSTIGGAIDNSGNLTITDSTLTHNTVSNCGGAINNNGNMALINTTLNHNHASGEYQRVGGGAIQNTGTLTITESNLTHNTANTEGGVIYNNDGGTVNISCSNLNYNNATDGNGGAIYNKGTVNIIESNLTSNTANVNGGAIYNTGGGTVNITQSNLNYNNATIGGGGAINKDSGTVTITESNLTHNTARDGGAIYNYRDILTITDSKLTHNTATRTGGSISSYASSSSSEFLIVIDNNTFTENSLTFTKRRNANLTLNITNNTFNNTIFYINNTNESKYINVYIAENKFDKSTGCLIDSIEGLPREINGFNDDYEYNDEFRSYLIEGNKNYKTTNLTITTDEDNPYINDTITITVTLKDIDEMGIGDKNITITVNDQDICNITTTKGGVATTTLSFNQSRKNTIKAQFIGDTDYNPSNDTITVNSQKLPTKITATLTNNTIGNTTLNVLVTDTYNNKKVTTGQIEVYGSNDNKLGNTTINTTGTTSINLDVKTKDITELNIRYMENDDYTNSTYRMSNIVIVGRQSEVEATTNNRTYLNTSINVTVKDPVTDTIIKDAQITITLPDGKEINTTTGSTGTVTVPLTLPVGSQKINIKFNGNNEYNASNNTLSINVEKRASTTAATINNKTAGNNTITIKVTDKTTKQPVTSGQIEIINNIDNSTVAKATISSANTTVTTTLNESGTYNLTVKYLGNDYYNASQRAVNNLNIQKRIATLTVKTVNNTLNNTMVNITLTDSSTGKAIPNAQVTIKLPNGTTVNTNIGTTGTVTQKITLPTGKNTINVTYTGSKTYNNASKNHTIDVKKLTTKTSITPVTAYLGDKITLKATVTAENNIKINEGNVIFKINGVTIKDNGKLTGSDNPLKVKVANGAATATITADSSMKNAAQITAHYIENTDYTASNSTPAKITLKPRTATITVTTNTKTIKQGQNLTITAKVTDTTSGKKINTTADEYVYFKINGITLKDANGEMLKAKVVNGIATIKYTIPLGLSCVTDTQSMTPKNQTILAVFYSKNYPDDTKNTTTFQVERSNITITLSNATINNKTHTLSMKITIKDYLGNTVAGPNKCIIKVNGVTLKNGTNVQYYYTTDGVLNLKNIPVPQSKNYTSVEVITQDRLAYMSQRNTTKVIKVTN